MQLIYRIVEYKIGTGNRAACFLTSHLETVRLCERSQPPERVSRVRQESTGW